VVPQVLDVYLAGNYSFTKACIKLERLSAMYVMQMGLACLIVLLSYLGSWINPKHAPGRIALGVISVLILTNNYYSVYSSLPNVAYRVFMMDFMLGALVFNVLAFVSCARYPAIPLTDLLFLCCTRARLRSSLVHSPYGRYGHQLRNVGRR
tara:strand:- start:397 stop:849 length:453 start_codon:yes stop_codon:yes gene_type:complete